MIDTIKGYLILDPRTNPKPIIELKEKIDNPKTQTNPQSQTGFLKGQIKNFKISIRYSLNDLFDGLAYQVSFEGSAPKFLYGNNIAQCSPKDIQSVLDALSDALSISLYDAKITRLDFGFNFVVRRPIPEYINAIQHFPRMGRVLYQDQTVSFRTSSKTREIIFYDKIEEMRKDRKAREEYKVLSENIKNLSILRYEVRLLKRSHNYLIKDLKFSQLFKPSFFVSLYKYMLETFNRLVIEDLEIPSRSFVSGHSWLKNFLASIGLHKYGVNEAFSLIDECTRDVKNPSVAKSQQKRQIRELVSINKEILHTGVKSELEGALNAFYGIF